MKVADVMTEQLFFISSGKSIDYAGQKMNELRVGSLAVMEEGQIVGIITSRDVRSSHPNRIVADAMSMNPKWILKNTFIGHALAIMEQNQIERLLVKDGDSMVGIVTREIIKTEIGKNIDPLTNLYRSSYIQYLFEAFVEEKILFHVLFIDLNNFGEINKKYSHPVGDDILKNFSAWLRDISTAEDYLCRYGGDEFVVITTRSKSDFDHFIQQLSTQLMFNHIPVSFAVGVLDGYQYDFSSLNYRESISMASKLSTLQKQSITWK